MENFEKADRWEKRKTPKKMEASKFQMCFPINPRFLIRYFFTNLQRIDKLLQNLLSLQLWQRLQFQISRVLLFYQI